MSARGAEWARSANERLSARGHRAGGARTAVIDALAQQDGCCTAAELAQILRATRGRVATASVYRALATLAEAGALRAVDIGDGERRFELVHADGDHHHHLVCRVCGTAIPFSDSALERAIDKIARRLGADVDAHDVTLHGTCGDCRRA